MTDPKNAPTLGKRKYDDDAFKRDLEMAAKASGAALESNANDVDVKQIIKSAL